jgi:N-acetyl-gamma-glutamyl-phosphate reductase
MSKQTRKTKVGIIGANGYGGGQLAQILSSHPEVEVAGYSSRQFQGQPFRAAWPNSHDNRVFETLEAVLDKSDFIFLALPNGLAMDMVPSILERGKKVVDLSADFRLPPAEYQKWYGKVHSSPELIKQAAYGLPELERAAIARAALTANPGCYVTTAAMALLPLARAGLISGSVVVDGISGISGGGRNADGFSYAEVNENVAAYKIAGTHRHTAEMEANLARAGQSAIVSFSPHIAPYTRGILCTCYVTPSRETNQSELEGLYRAAFEHEFFVRYTADLPTPKATVGSNRCDVSVRFDPRANRIVAVAALDNLIKGMSGEAVQNMNLMLGLPEDMGLSKWGMWP